MRRKYAKTLVPAALLLAAVMLQSCGLIKINHPAPAAETKTADGTTLSDMTTPVEEVIDYPAKQDAFFAALPDVNYGGADFIVMSSVGGLLFDDGTTVFSAAVTERNRTVAEKYGVKIAELEVSRDTMLSELLASVASSSYYADLLLLPVDKVGTFALGGGLMNLRGVPFLDVSCEYFSPSSVSASTYSGRTYAAAGPASLERDDVACLYYNKGIAAKLGTGDLYELVKKGEWTWDRFFEIMRLYDGCGELEDGSASLLSVDPFAGVIADVVFHSSCETYLGAKDGGFALSDGLSAGSKLLDYARMFNTAGLKYTGNDAASDFAGGAVAFMLDTLGTSASLANSPNDWGILPVPSESGRHGTYIAPDKAALFAIPKGTADAEKSGVIMSALNASSFGVLDYAYVRHALDRVLRDGDSANMMDMIISSVVYDPASALAPAVPAVNSAVFGISYRWANGYDVPEWEITSALSECADALDDLGGR